jgi:intracellular multiplication protein IcmX
MTGENHMKQRLRVLKNKKISSLLAATIAGVTLCPLAFADSPPPTPAPAPDNGAVIAAINALSNKMEALALAGIKTVNNTVYQMDQGLMNSLQYDNTNTSVNSTMNTHAQHATEKDIQNGLTQFSDQALTYTTQTPDVTTVAARIQKRANQTDDLTVNAPASDTLYSDVMGIDAYATNGYTLSKPSVLHDDYFNFGTLINPEAYTTDQKQAVNHYLDYLTQDYQSLTDGIDFTTLVNTLNNYKTQPQQLAQMLQNFRNSDSYKKYQLSVRTLLASRSVSLTNFNKLIAERSPLETTTPDDNLATISIALGVKPQTVTAPDPQDAGHNITKYVYASPLQVENYLANHRLNDPQWSQNIASASATTLQRETVVLLAEMQSQMYQHHLDEERILATLSVMQLQSSNNDQMMLKAQVNDLNQTIKSLTNANQSQNSANTAAAQAAAQAAQQQQQQNQPANTGSGSGNSNP